MPVAASLAHLLDDAGSPPSGALDGLVGSRVVRDTDLAGVPDPDAAAQPVTLVVTGGAGQVAGPLALVARRGPALHAVHLTARDAGDPLGATRRLVAAVDEARRAGDLPDDVAVRVGLPAAAPTHGWLAAADEVAAADLGLLLPVAAAAGDPGPSAATVVAWLDAALAREAPFALALGDHHAVRSGAGHGLLNLLLATRASLDGAAEDDLVWLLDTTDGESLVDLLVETGDDAVARARRWLTSAAVTDTAACAADLRALGVLA